MLNAPAAHRAAAVIVNALFSHGSPSAYSTLTDPDTTRRVHLDLGAAYDLAMRAVATDADLAALTTAVRVGVSARSDREGDERHAARICRDLRDRWAACSTRTARAATVHA